MDWTNNKLHNFLRFLPPLKWKLYTTVANKIDSYGCKSILDYGCGEGNQIDFLDSSLAMDIYDINESFARSAFQRFVNSNKSVKLLPDIKTAAPSSYDAVIVNMVWMCLGSPGEVSELIKDITRVKKKDGFIFISITNPYSRSSEFSYYQTEYSRGSKVFDYFSNGEAFDVYIKDEAQSTFTDYHWTMEYTLQTLLRSGLSLIEYIDLGDEEFNRFSNQHETPYIMMILR